ncbi:MAG: dihydrolipoamide dehydrogenase [Flavobacteriaceae bacterium]|nr:dihydrolipoamide dehydrogenase [Flavobacteriaceae bacterium]|tara:strand:- start:12401 stop:13240 length:840 start_codon:yes stop_codon:yes gene_type:complete
MKKIFLTLLLIPIFSFAQVLSPQPSPSASINQTVGLTDIKIEYSRPSMRGRVIFGNLVPFGELWRTGANANTKISFSDSVTISGETISSGTYAIYTRPGKEIWEVFFYKKSDNWSLPEVWDPKQIAVVSESNSSIINGAPIESFTIQLETLTNNNLELTFSWEKTKVTTLIEVPTHQKTMASIDKTLSKNPSGSDYYKSAVYYLNSDLDLKQAKEWIEIAIEKGADKYWHLRQYSLILAALNENEAAIEIAKKSYELAEIAGNKDYLKMNKDSIEEWSK